MSAASAPFVRRAVALLALLLAPAVQAIVIRDDVDDAKYRMPAQALPALADLPGEGHGVLIAPQWVVTAAHAVSWQGAIRQIVLNGVARDVQRVIVHPGFQQPSQTLLDQGLATWDWTLFRVLLASSDDIALIQLAQPVTDVAPLAMNTLPNEYGQDVEIWGKGATGHGASGYAFSDPHRTALRRAQNRISSAHGRWICYTFDRPPEGLPLEGGSGSGDSGGPVLRRTDDQGWLVLGLTAWVDPQSTVRTPGRYGQVSCNVRLHHYQDWLKATMAAPR